MSSWDERQVIEAEKSKTLAEAELSRTKPEYMQAAIEMQEKRRIQQVARAIVKTIGPAAMIHFIWAVTVVAVCWIIVVEGWRAPGA